MIASVPEMAYKIAMKVCWLICVCRWNFFLKKNRMKSDYIPKFHRIQQKSSLCTLRGPPPYILDTPKEKKTNKQKRTHQ